METEAFFSRLVGTSGCEIVGPDGVIGWTVDGHWAAMIAALLNSAEKVSLTPPFGSRLTET